MIRGYTEFAWAVLKTLPKKGRDMRGLRRFWYVMLGEYATSRVCYPLHRVIYRLSGGRITFSMIGPVILLTTTGRKSGKPRTAPLLGFQEGQSIIVIPSNAGKKHYPSWYLNLRANPQAQVQVGRELRQVRAGRQHRRSRNASGRTSPASTAATTPIVSVRTGISPS
jgi:deazaflavin-dependent oxidoreductase (nitroreductase family)